MTKTEQAIKDAIKGRYDSQIVRYHQMGLAEVSDVLLDPNFWQCLGKTRGWRKWICEKGEHDYRGNMRYSPYRERKYGYTEAFWFPKKEYDNPPLDKRNLRSLAMCRREECSSWGPTYFLPTWLYQAKFWFKNYAMKGRSSEEYFGSYEYTKMQNMW